MRKTCQSPAIGICGGGKDWMMGERRVKGYWEKGKCGEERLEMVGVNKEDMTKCKGLSEKWKMWRREDRNGRCEQRRYDAYRRNKDNNEIKVGEKEGESYERS